VLESLARLPAPLPVPWLRRKELAVAVGLLLMNILATVADVVAVAVAVEAGTVTLFDAALGLIPCPSLFEAESEVEVVVVVEGVSIQANPVHASVCPRRMQAGMLGALTSHMEMSPLSTAEVVASWSP
jgi:hypothetical protein